MTIDDSIPKVGNNPLLGIANLISAEHRKYSQELPPVAEKVASFANSQGLLDTAFTQG
ncbi:MAG: hypothetical protein K1X28_08825 [Parachlamydiales bacterium]|nr:hypothetical protein [Parachlamydiales bacterium]